MLFTFLNWRSFKSYHMTDLYDAVIDFNLKHKTQSDFFCMHFSYYVLFLTIHWDFYPWYAHEINLTPAANAFWGISHMLDYYSHCCWFITVLWTGRQLTSWFTALICTVNCGGNINKKINKKKTPMGGGIKMFSCLQNYLYFTVYSGCECPLSTA